MQLEIRRALLIDEAPLFNITLAQLLEQRGYAVHTVEEEDRLLPALRLRKFQWIFCNQSPTLSLHETCSLIKEFQPQAILVLLTEPGRIDQEYLRPETVGAQAVLRRPFSIPSIADLIGRLEQQMPTVQEEESSLNFLPQELRQGFVAESPLMLNLIRDLITISDSRAHVFLTGESGSGKEVIAEIIHSLSPRASRPFIKINCAAIPDTLIESEFFGHEKGAFTGASSRRPGRFELAHQGSLLLDEISESPLFFQAKLLRAVQQQEFERVGGQETLHVDVRLISTSNKNMQEAIAKKLFREDLFYRLNVIPLHIPALRDRKEDILPLAEYFLVHFAKENQRMPKTLSGQAIQVLLNYDWPGNVRELANLMERASLLSPSAKISAEDLRLRDLKSPLPDLHSLAQMEKRAILETLAKTQQNRTAAAKKLGISIRTLRNKLKEYSSDF